MFGFIIDFTLGDNNELNLLEAGYLNGAGTTGFDRLNIASPISKRYLENLQAKIGKPYFLMHIGGSLGTWKCISSDETEQQKLNHSFGFSKIDSTRCTDLFLALTAKKHNRNILITADELALVNWDELDRFFHWVREQNVENLNFYPMVPNAEFLRFCQNKDIFHLYMQNTDSYPRTFIAKEAPCQTEIEEFIEKSQSKSFVLKPTDQYQGIGVIVLTADKVIPYLNSIRQGSCADTYWRQNPQAPCIIQVCKPSKKITAANGKQYRPTGRLVFAINPACIGDKEFSYELLGAYWKLPLKECTENEELNSDNLISRISSRKEKLSSPISAVMSEEDLNQIMKQFNRIYPIILNKIFSHRASTDSHLLDNQFTALVSHPAHQDLAITKFFNSLDSHDALDERTKRELTLLFSGLPYQLAQREATDRNMKVPLIMSLYQALPSQYHLKLVESKYKIIDFSLNLINKYLEKKPAKFIFCVGLTHPYYISFPKDTSHKDLTKYLTEFQSLGLKAHTNTTQFWNNTTIILEDELEFILRKFMSQNDECTNKITAGLSRS